MRRWSSKQAWVEDIDESRQATAHVRNPLAPRPWFFRNGESVVKVKE